MRVQFRALLFLDSWVKGLGSRVSSVYALGLGVLGFCFLGFGP